MLGQIFQPMLEQLNAISKQKTGVINNVGTVIAFVGQPIDYELACDAVINRVNNNQPYVLGDYTFVAFGLRNTMDYVVYVQGTSEESQKFCLFLSVSLSNMQQHCGDKYDKTNYLKNVLLGNVLPGDIFLHSDELQIDTEIPRVVYIVHIVETTEASIQHILQNMFPEQDFVICIDNLSVVLIKSLPNDYTQDYMTKIAKSIIDTINSELMVQAYVGMGAPTETINDLARSYSEAQLALEIGHVFEGDQYILSYDSLGIGRLIYQLPSKLCELFLDEIFKKESINVLDEETLQTIYQFFENNLNVSETSRQLFVHRNTLVYRLDKIERLTGLDLRQFDDAVTFKVAILVNKYLQANSGKF